MSDITDDVSMMVKDEINDRINSYIYTYIGIGIVIIILFVTVIIYFNRWRDSKKNTVVNSASTNMTNDNSTTSSTLTTSSRYAPASPFLSSYASFNPGSSSSMR